MRRAFTLVELLVVLVVVAVLLGLLLPAIQAARETARRAKCQNHLKQIGLAFHNYLSTFGYFPGYAGEVQPELVFFDNNQANSSLLGINWIGQSLRFLEHDSLASRWTRLQEFKATSPASERRELYQTSVATFHCPSRRDAAAYPMLPHYQSEYGEFAARTDYAINGGKGYVPNDGTSFSQRSVRITDHGIWQMGRRTSDRDILDGLSQSYLVGEKSVESAHYHDGRGQGDQLPIAGDPLDNDTPSSYLRYAVRPPARDRRTDCLACHDFGSAHAAGWNVVLADGAVRFQSYDLDLQLHQALATIAAGEMLSQ